MSRHPQWRTGKLLHGPFDVMLREWMSTMDAVQARSPRRQPDGSLYVPTAWESVFRVVRITPRGDDPGFRFDRVLDWWHNATVSERAELLQERGAYYGPQPVKRPGEELTLEMLWATRDDAWATAFVWIATWLWHMRDDRDWKVEDLAYKFRNALSKELELPRWSHQTKYTLPNTIYTWRVLPHGALKTPIDEMQLMKLIALDVAIIQSMHTMVCITNDPEPLKLVVQS